MQQSLRKWRTRIYMDTQEHIKILEEKIGYTFQNKALLQQALTHSSYANERKTNLIKDYERIEFLGDAVLELVSSEFLYQTYPDYLEGEMTKLRSTYVCEPALAFCARELGLGQFLYLGKGEAHTGGKDRDSILADCVESIIGAIFLDRDFEHAKSFIHRCVLSDLENKRLFYDSKSSLQEMVQKEGRNQIIYKLIAEVGPEHQKIFKVEVALDEHVIGIGQGKSKKLAEQNAAYEGIKYLQNK